MSETERDPDGLPYVVGAIERCGARLSEGRTRWRCQQPPGHKGKHSSAGKVWTDDDAR